MKLLEAFTPKDIRTCARLLRKVGMAGKSVDDIIEYADSLSLSRTYTIVGPATKRRTRRTPEEQAARKKTLEEAEYGSIKVKP